MYLAPFKIPERLKPEKVTSIHWSIMVNVDHIKELQSWSHEKYAAILTNGEILKISSRYQKNLFMSV